MRLGVQVMMDSRLLTVCQLPAGAQCFGQPRHWHYAHLPEGWDNSSDGRNMHDYPNSVDELDLTAVELSPAVLTAVRRFARSRPWRGSLAERKVKFRAAIRRICRAAGIPAPRTRFQINQNVSSGSSCYLFGAHAIILRGRLSVITTLHEVGHALHGRSEQMACAWSLAYFRACFPRSWRRLKFDGHMAIVDTEHRRRGLGATAKALG